MKVAIAHDYLVQYGGAERVVEALHEAWPDAPVYTSMYEPDKLPQSFAGMDIRTSFMQRLPKLRRHWKAALALYPAAIESLDMRGYDVVISSSSGWAHGVRADKDAYHVVYCHTPARWLYRTGSYLAIERAAAAALLPGLRRWDQRSAARPTEYVANSQNVRARIHAAYGRTASVIHPPVGITRFLVDEPEDYYLCVARLMPYKRIDLAIEACRRLGVRLVVAGDGPARKRLEQLGGGEVEFTGRVPDEEIARLLARCRALIVPAEEDFCITAVEAMAAGRPVIGYAAGGLLETVQPRRTGVLFKRQTTGSLCAAIERLEDMSIHPWQIRAHAARFNVRSFQDEFRALVEGTPVVASVA